MLRKILLIGNICCLLFLMLYFLLVVGFFLDGTESKYGLYIYLLIMICFALNIYFLANSKEELEKWGYIKSKEINIKEVLLIMGNIGLFEIFVRNFDVSHPNTTILSISLTGVPLLNIFYIFHSKVLKKNILKEKKMNTNRKCAIIAGVLYIVAKVASVLSMIALGSLLEDPGILMNVSANENRVIMAALLELIMAIAVAGIAFMIYPILKKNSAVKEGLARWYVGTRIVEGGIFLVAILGLLSILTLSREFVSAGAPIFAPYFETITNALLVVSDYARMLGYIVFCLGALMLYYLLYESKLVPRWLSVWGFIGAPLMLVARLLPILINEDPNSMLSMALNFPLAWQEMVFAIWLIFMGFNSSAIASESTKQM